MSYKALYRKYRPNNFDEVRGQDHIVITLKNIIQSRKIGHAYLFAGPRGTGKTTVAHVFAKEVNRNAADQLVFNEMDIIEIDAASNNGVAEVRQIIDNSKYAPSESKYKVYIIDEVHMLSKSAFNALLKTLEEPPAHVIFILATTEPHKIPVTILSRTQRFNFRRIDDLTIHNQLIDVLQKEGITFENDAIRFIAKLSQGGLRDALSIADQASAFGNGNISFSTISQVFGIISISNQIHMLNLAYNGKTRELLSLISKFFENGADIERLSLSLIDIIKDFIVYKKTQDKQLISTLTIEEIQDININLDYAYDVLDVLVKLLSDLRFSLVPRQSFELSMLKITNSNSEVSNSSEIFLEEQSIKPTLNPNVDEVIDLNEPIIENKNIENVVSENKNIENTHIKKTDSRIFNTSNIFLETPKQNSGVMDTDEIELTSEILLKEKEEQQVINSLNEDIISTQEIPLNEIDKVEDSTQDIDLMSAFNLTDTNDVEIDLNKYTISIDEIINLLQLFDKDISTQYKQRLSNIITFADDAKSTSYASLLDATKLIVAGQNFIMVAAYNDQVKKRLREDKTANSFLEFTKKVFGKPIHVYAISSDEYEAAKKAWIEHKTNGTLPVPHPVEGPKINQRPKTEEEAFGESIFGDIFNN